MFSFSNNSTIDFYSNKANEDLGIKNLSSLNKEIRDSIEALDKAYFPQPWGPKQWMNVFEDTQGLYLIGICATGDAAYGLLVIGLGNPDSSHLYKVLIDPEIEGHGHGTELLNKSANILKLHSFKTLYLEVEYTNTRALNFYQKLGFSRLVEKKDFYGQGRNAWAMELSLT